MPSMNYHKLSDHPEAHPGTAQALQKLAPATLRELHPRGSQLEDTARHEVRARGYSSLSDAVGRVCISDFSEPIVCKG